jgi:hypothetical protein
MMNTWQELTATGSTHGVRSHMIPSTWPYDKYPEMPELDAGRTVILIDQDGPGVVSCLHISNYFAKQPFGPIPPGAPALLIRVWYDHQAQPAIAMPLMDFLGDIQGESAYFSSLYFSKVKHSHNFRLPMPYRSCVYFYA